MAGEFAGVGRVPVLWNYDYDRVIGHAKVQPDGTVAITITDPELVDFIRADQRRFLRGLSTSFTPAVPFTQIDQRQPNFD